MKKLSVIIPVYGVEKYIERCARSLFEQTLSDVEYLFIDDCSPDKSIEVVLRIINEYRTLLAGKGCEARTVRMPTNSGQAAVRRHGIQLATGEYIIQCDSDDWINDSQAYERMYEKAKNEGLDVVICEYYEGDELNKFQNRIKSHSEDQMLIGEMLTHSVPVSICNKMIRAQLFCNKMISYPQNNMGEDFVLTVQIAYFAKKVGYIHEPYYFYYRNSASITKQQSRESMFSRYCDMKANIRIISDFLKRVRIYDQYEEEIRILKEDCRYFLQPLVDDKNMRQEWLTVYPDLKYGMLDVFKKGKRKYAIRYFLVATNLYVYLRAVKRLVQLSK